MAGAQAAILFLMEHPFISMYPDTEMAEDSSDRFLSSISNPSIERFSFKIKEPDVVILINVFEKFFSLVKFTDLFAIMLFWLITCNVSVTSISCISSIIVIFELANASTNSLKLDTCTTFISF